MKGRILKTIALLFLVFALSEVQSQCTSDDFLDKCASSLAEFTFIKSFNVKIDNGADKYEYSYVFSKGSTYKLIICDENINGNRMIVTMYDRNHKVIAKNYNPATKKFYPSLSYACSATGVYYMEVAFEKNKTGCGVNILGFSKP